MATVNNTGSQSAAFDAPRTSQSQPSEFELRRTELVGEIGAGVQSLEQVLTQINALNRSLEGIIEIGNEFSSVEALWSQFETVMGRPEDGALNGQGDDGTDSGPPNANANANNANPSEDKGSNHVGG